MLVVPSVTLSAEDNSDVPGEKVLRDHERIFGGAITECALVVRQEIKGSDFDAYYKDASTIAIYGSPKERFAFEKCMHKKGYPVGPKWYDTP